ncbi:BZ3500_MvSof-1268-A1-R1_Chr1-1g00995 [Microbotryum saponariae]|uniref:BZ3500_MvSof-1268-A1-R1_Chr1-1g00995 protein n=1 Tax=Microbotryum saponariae TaxID=289078 RepID=A0A2X0KAB3_9BASI|nr:BZ3500_MvSof-1268-A1-R1_Chr1-1g00995 [Microbotryum saponariae]SCZ93131.1 BZ3501_MvSof-1269-A2-R1_Chr1-1g00592 [Microbotryum saponariae]
MSLFPPPTQDAASVLASLPLDSKRHMLVFLASHEERGRPWCRDCEAAEPLIVKYLDEKNSTVIWVGSREEWTKPDNVWRQKPWNVQRVPTLIKIEASTSANVTGQESPSIEDRISNAPHLVEADILEGSKLRGFVA